MPPLGSPSSSSEVTAPLVRAAAPEPATSRRRTARWTALATVVAFATGVLAGAAALAVVVVGWPPPLTAGVAVAGEHDKHSHGDSYAGAAIVMQARDSSSALAAAAARGAAPAVARGPARAPALDAVAGGSFSAARAESGDSGRYAGPALDAMDEQQRAIYDEIARSRPRTGVRGPFRPWLANAALADAAQRLGRVCRYGTSLPPGLSEVAILTCAAHHRSEVEWRIHEGEARLAGVHAAAIARIKAGDADPFHHPSGNRTEAAESGGGVRAEAAATVHAFAAELLRASRVSDGTYARAAEQVGDRGVVELIAIVGYYSLVAYTLNALELQDGG